ncbi:MAG: SGNH/GDSL hydrolase family protein, partial [Nitrospiraceae bacterium]
QLLDKAGARPPFYVYDDLMGWTVGPNRRSENGLYYSSSERIRAPHEGVSFAQLKEKTRIALVGDSYTFGEDVAYEDTWGYLLEKALGPEFEVLNFGVPGYGVDQAYLRYEKDVRKWKPKVVIFSFISHDVERTMTVYTPLSYPEWDMPFSKPRFILRDGDLTKLNVPPLASEAIFSRGSVSELPFLEFDRGYRQSDWRQSFFHFSYLARAFMIWFPRWEAVTPDVSDEALVLVNASILKAFVRSAEQAGAAPVVVYHPKKGFAAGSLGKQVLQEAGLAYTDPTSCLLELDPADWFIPHGHYTPQGNAAVAKCLLNVVRQALVKVS